MQELAEAAIHGMRELFEEEEAEAVLLIDASNAFNSMNRMVGLHNIRIQCPYLSKYLINTYRQCSQDSSLQVVVKLLQWRVQPKVIHLTKRARGSLSPPSRPTAFPYMERQ